ncbi:P-loop containing nucleoside triphosphate hydrolase protein [Lasiosphaeria miniovina]|uniref:RNA helicase n=1 Tax=Lasiosphaeria miniovina TaxID=1954250 RepID=A0AA40DZW8_9PEZI|nr:P-loop containing nucleoside triphosphate hydrolase protein [Lasiosphaeria miniovina]KAK0722734.1 P-loop containing nucleoside triphosphate hydrolase protein [Lasiosphaeria miniovina]
MWRTARDSVCLLCASAGATGRPRAVEAGRPLMSTAPGSASRTFATRLERRPAPARMVLSDRADVARSSPRRTADGAIAKKAKPRGPDGPWAGTNRTVANIDTRRRALLPGAVTRDPLSNEDDQGNGKGKKRGRWDRRGFKALNMQRSLTSVSYGQRASVKERIQAVDSFGLFDLLPSIKDAIASSVLKGMVDIKPTPIQRLTIPALLGQHMDPKRRRPRVVPDRKEVLLAAETGSGKTLAYLLPIANALKLAEADDTTLASYNKRLEAEKVLRGDRPMSEWIDKFEPHPNMARPRAVVLVPTAELVDQVVAVAKDISHLAKFKARPLSASHNTLKIQRNLYSPTGIDLVVATPHLLASIANSDPYVLSRVSHLVIDEADSLLDRSFSPETTSIIDRCMPTLKQFVLCSATIPKRLDTYLESKFPDVERITTPNLHAIPRRVQLGVIDVSKDPYRNNKNLACADAIWSIGKEAAQHEGPVKGVIDVKRIIVFVNERETTQEVAEYLVSKGVDAVALHRDTPELRQSEMIASFTSSEPLLIDAATAATATATAAAGRRHLPNTKVIVATDLASRGLDTVAVRHVILYDVPHTSIDFVHRLGRALV